MEDAVGLICFLRKHRHKGHMISPIHFENGHCIAPFIH